MATATVVRSWTDETGAHLAVKVTEASGVVEYIGTAPNDAAFQALSNAQKKQALIDACKSVRDSQQKPAPVDLAFSGNVTV